MGGCFCTGECARTGQCPRSNTYIPPRPVTPVTPATRGWLCPACGAGVAPWVQTCPNCSSRTVTVTNVT